MKKTFGKIVALAMASMFLLSGCGNSASPTPGPTTAPPATSPTATADPSQPTEDTKPAYSGTLNYVSFWNETEKQASIIKQAINEFKEDYPDVTINVQWMGRNLTQTIKTMLDAGQVDMADFQLNELVVKYSDSFIPLEDYYAKDWPTTNGKTFNEYIPEAYVTLVKDAAPDKLIHAIPYQPNAVAMFYNKEMFATAGITAVPTTWEELLAACDKLVAAGITPMSMDAGYSVLSMGTYLGRLKGLDWVKTLVTDKTGAQWDDPAVLEAAKMFEEMAKKGYFSANTAANVYPAGQNEFALKQVAMYYTGSYMVNEVAATAGNDFPWGAFMYPSPSGAAMDNSNNIIGCTTFGITKNCANPEVAFLFGTYLTSGKFDALMSDITLALPTTADTPWPSTLADVKNVVDQTKVTITWAYGLGANPDATATFKDNYLKLCGGQMTAEEFVSTCKAAVVGQ